jgi:hypothetical protein
VRWAAGPQRGGVGAVDDQADRCGVRVEQHQTRLTEPVGGILAALITDDTEELL